jgi:hypothetical protein
LSLSILASDVQRCCVMDFNYDMISQVSIIIEWVVIWRLSVSLLVFQCHSAQ